MTNHVNVSVPSDTPFADMLALALDAPMCGTVRVQYLDYPIGSTGYADFTNVVFEANSTNDRFLIMETDEGNIHYVPLNNVMSWSVL